MTLLTPSTVTTDLGISLFGKLGGHNIAQITAIHGNLRKTTSLPKNERYSTVTTANHALKKWYISPI